MRRLIPFFGATILLVCGVGPVRAQPITGSLTGLPDPQTTITFDGLNLPDYTPITNQFAASGVTFQNFGYGNGDEGELGSIGFSGQDLYSGDPFNFPGPAVISFSAPVTAAAFAIIDQYDTFTFNAYLGGTGGTLVDTFSETIPGYPGQGFVGFQNETFDTIQITSVSNSAFGIDSLQIGSVPEPGTMALMVIAVVGLLGCYGLGRAAAWTMRESRDSYRPKASATA